MKDRLPFDEDMEVMLTSYLLGELGDSEVRKIELALKENPELRAVAKELEASISLLRQATSDESGEVEKAQEVPRKLNQERRNHLLTSLREQDAIKPKGILQLPWFIPMGIAAGLIALLSAYSFMLQTDSSMKDAIGSAELLTVDSGQSRHESVELFSNSMTPTESLMRIEEPESVSHFFTAPSSESNRYRSLQVIAPTEEPVDVKRNSSRSQSVALDNDFIDPQTAEESKNRNWFESRIQSLPRGYIQVKKPTESTAPQPSFGRASRSKELKQFESLVSENEAIPEDGATLLGAIEMVREEQSDLDLATSFTRNYSVENTPEPLALPSLNSPAETDHARDGFSVLETAPQTEMAWGTVDNLEVLQATPKAAKGLVELSKRSNLQRWAYQPAKKESYFDQEAFNKKSQMEGEPIQSTEKNVQSVSGGARFGLYRGSDAKKFSDETELGFGEVEAEDVLASDVTHSLFALTPDASIVLENESRLAKLTDHYGDFAQSGERYTEWDSDGAMGGGGDGLASNGISAGTGLTVKSENTTSTFAGVNKNLNGGRARRQIRNDALNFDANEVRFDVRGETYAEGLGDVSDQSGNEALGIHFAKPTSGLRDSGVESAEGEAKTSDAFLGYGFQTNQSEDFGTFRPEVVMDNISVPVMDESREFGVEKIVEEIARGRESISEQLWEDDSSKTFQRKSSSALPSLGKRVATRSAGNFGDVMKRLDDLGELEGMTRNRGLNDQLSDEKQVILQQLGDNVAPLQQLQESIVAQTATPAPIELSLGEASASLNLGRKLAEGRDFTVSGPAPSAPQPENKSRPKPASNVDHHPEFETSEKSVSTFSLNVSDVSFKLAKAALSEGQLPAAESIRSEQFLNAFDYRDPAPYSNQPIGFYAEQAQHPFAHHRDVVRFAIQTAAKGRESDRAMHLTILLDNSGSMERSDRREILSQALNVLCQQLTSKDKISVVSFARTARLWVDGVEGGSPMPILDKVNDLTPQGGTNLEEALDAAYEVATDHYIKDGVNRVVLLTDGAANLGNVDPEELKDRVVTERKRGIAFDCFGIGWDGLNDPLLEVLSRNGDGRYGFLNNASDASHEFADQLAGALNVAASDVKVQVEFNPERVKHWRQIGYAKHQLSKEQFRDNTVDAAEIAAAESGNALYVFEPIEKGSGPIGQVRVRYRVPHTSVYEEKEWTVPYKSSIPSVEDSSAAMKLALASGLFAEWLNGNPHAGSISIESLQEIFHGVPETYGKDPRPYELQQMFEQVRNISGL